MSGDNITWIIQLLTSLGIGAIVYFAKSAFKKMEDGIVENQKRIDDLRKDSDSRIDEVRKACTAEIDKVKTEVNDLKADLPFVYVMREDFVRSLNSVDEKMGRIDGKLDKIMQMKGGSGPC